MSVQALTWVIEHSKARLGDRCVLFSIANHCDREGGCCYPSIFTIAHEALVSKRQAQRSIRDLETKLKELRVERATGPNGTNRYFIVGMTTSSSLLAPVSAGTKDGGAKLSGGAKLAPVTNKVKNRPDLSPEPSRNRQMDVRTDARARVPAPRKRFPQAPPTANPPPDDHTLGAGVS